MGWQGAWGWYWSSHCGPLGSWPPPRDNYNLKLYLECWQVQSFPEIWARCIFYRQVVCEEGNVKLKLLCFVTQFKIHWAREKKEHACLGYWLLKSRVGGREKHRRRIEGARGGGGRDMCPTLRLAFTGWGVGALSEALAAALPQDWHQLALRSTSQHLQFWWRCCDWLLGDPCPWSAISLWCPPPQILEAPVAHGEKKAIGIQSLLSGLFVWFS